MQEENTTTLHPTTAIIRTNVQVPVYVEVQDGRPMECVALVRPYAYGSRFLTATIEEWSADSEMIDWRSRRAKRVEVPGHLSDLIAYVDTVPSGSFVEACEFWREASRLHLEGPRIHYGEGPRIPYGEGSRKSAYIY